MFLSVFIWITNVSLLKHILLQIRSIHVSYLKKIYKYNLTIRYFFADD